MTSKTVGGGGGRQEGGRQQRFLSAHRCPEVERLSHHLTETKPYHTATDNMQGEPEDTQGDHPNIAGKEWDVQGSSNRKAESSTEADYMEVYSGRRSSSRPSAEDQEEEVTDDEGSVSDWSEEDLSLHFSPSVILSSDEGSDVDGSFECVDVAMAKEGNGQEKTGQRMVPKRQIQLRRRDSEEEEKRANEEKSMVKEKEDACERGGAKGETSTNEPRSPQPRHRPEGLLRQHSMPASFHQRPVANPEDSHNNSIYKGIIAGATQGLPGVVRSQSNPRQRLKKSFSLDETKAKMASCIIKSVLSKKMQVEQSTVASSESHNSCNKYTNSVSTCCSNNVKNTTEPSSNNTKNYLQLASQSSSTDVTTQPLQGKKTPVVRQSSGSLPPSQGGKPPEPNSHTQPGDQEREGEGGGGEELRFPSCPGGKATSGSVFKAKAPVHVVRDMRSLVKNTYNLSFRNNNNNTAASSAMTTTGNGIGQNHSPPSTLYKVIGQEDSPPPSYQQAVGVKGHDETIANRRGSQSGAQPTPSVPASRGYVARVTAALGQSLERRECERFSHSIPEQRKASQPATAQTEQEPSNETWPKTLSNTPSKISTVDQSTEPIPSDSGPKQKPPQAETPNSRHTVPSFISSAVDSQQPLPDSSSPCQPQQNILPPTSQGQSHMLGFPPPSAPGCVLATSGPGQPLMPSYFYAPNPLAGYTAALQAHMGSYIQGPVSYIQAPPSSQAQLSQTLVQAQPSSTFHMLKRTQSEEKQERTTPGVSSYHPDGYKGLIKYSPPHKNSTTASQENKTSKVTPETQQQQQQPQQQQQQQQIMYNVQGFLPTNAGGEFQQGRTQFVYPGMAPSTAAPGGLYGGHATRHVLLDPESGQCFYMDMPPQPQRKMLFDPETGRYVEVYLPTSNPAPTTTVLPVGCRAVPYHPSLAMSALYAPQYLPFTLQTPTVNLTHTAP